MATKAKYTGPHAEVFAEGYMQGVEDAQRDAEANAPAVAAIHHAVATQVVESQARGAELDRAFGINQAPKHGVVVVGNVQRFGAGT